MRRRTTPARSMPPTAVVGKRPVISSPLIVISARGMTMGPLVCRNRRTSPATLSSIAPEKVLPRLSFMTMEPVALGSLLLKLEHESATFRSHPCARHIDCQQCLLDPVGTRAGQIRGGQAPPRGAPAERSSSTGDTTRRVNVERSTPSRGGAARGPVGFSQTRLSSTSSAATSRWPTARSP